MPPSPDSDRDPDDTTSPCLNASRYKHIDPPYMNLSLPARPPRLRFPNLTFKPHIDYPLPNKPPRVISRPRPSEALQQPRPPAPPGASHA